jgi:hypothetical protein
MKMDMTFNLNGTGYEYETNIAAMDMTALNPFAEPFSLMSVKSGTIQKIKMKVKATRNIAKGNLDMHYNDLKVQVLKNDEDKNKLKKRWLLTAVSNAFVPNDNPKGNGKFRKGPIYVERDPNMSFFGFMSKTMLDGMTSSITGIDQKKEKPDNIIVKTGAALFNPGKTREEKSRKD